MKFRFRIWDSACARARAVCLVLTLSFVAGVTAQPPTPSQTPDPQSKIAHPGAPFLWKITGAGAAPSWIFGTIHLARPDVATPPPAVSAALDHAAAVYTEIPMDPTTILSLMPHLLLPDGRSLPTILTPELAAELKAELQRSGTPNHSLASINRLKPWAASVTLIELDDQARYPGTLALDMVLFQRAVMAGKEAGGLETPSEQLAIFDELSPAEQTILLRDTLAQLRDARAQGRNLSDSLAALYLAGDLHALVTELSNLDAAANHPEFSAKLMERLLYRRNDRMATRIIAKIRAHPEKSYFFAVGAAHLEGDRGLLAALEKAGFQLTRTQ